MNGRTAVGAMIVATLGLSGIATAGTPGAPTDPVDVSAKSMRLDKTSCVTTYDGEAEMVVAGMTMRGDRIELFGERAESGGCGAPERAEIEGSVVVRAGDSEVRGQERAVYHFRTRTVEGEGRSTTIRTVAGR